MIPRQHADRPVQHIVIGEQHGGIGGQRQLSRQQGDDSRPLFLLCRALVTLKRHAGGLEYRRRVDLDRRHWIGELRTPGKGNGTLLPFADLVQQGQCCVGGAGDPVRPHIQRQLAYLAVDETVCFTSEQVVRQGRKEAARPMRNQQPPRAAGQPSGASIASSTLS